MKHLKSFDLFEGSMASQKSINQLKKAAKGTTKTTTGAKTPKNVQSYEQHVKSAKNKKK